jgi:hypothetical protein
MRKLTTMFVLIISFSMVFAGAVSAQEPATVDVAVTDENGVPVDIVCNGTNVTLAINVSANDMYMWNPDVEILVNPDTGLVFDANNAVMYFNGVEYTNDPNDPFFYWSDTLQAWEWWIGWEDSMYTGDEAQLFVPALVTDTGAITVTGDLYNQFDSEEWTLVDSDSDNFLSVPCRGCHHCHGGPCGETVPMQATGSPLAVAALGLLSIIGGAVYGKLR